jgi:outer membrane receptor protein involved in Fe transport
VRDRSDLHGGSSHSAVSPRLGAVWHLRDETEGGLELFAEIGRAFRAPTLDQLFDPRPFDGPAGPFTLSNSALEPQRSRGWEVGLQGRKPRSSWRIVAYRMEVENEIDFDPATFRYANIGRSRHEGLESSWRRALGRAGEVRLSYVRSQVGATGPGASSGQLKNIPRDVARLGWNVRLRGDVELDLRQSLLAGRWADDAHLYRLGDVLRTDLRLTRAVGDYRLRLDVLNLFDQDALELAYLLPNATFDGETLHGFAPLPRAVRLGVERSW